MAYDLSDYVDVSERIAEFREKHPEGSFQVRMVSVPSPWNEKFIAVEARAYRTPDDERPGIDVAWEPVPGKTKFTQDSELMNCSTSAVGRAIVYALAADTKRGIASYEEVRNRADVDGGGGQPSGVREADEAGTPVESTAAVSTGFVSKKQKDFWHRLLKQAGLTYYQGEAITRYAETIATERIKTAIDGLKSKDDETRDKVVAALLRESDEYALRQTDLPFDESQ